MIWPVARNAATAKFFDGAAKGQVFLRKSIVTGEVLSPPAEQDSVGNTDLEWMAASGLGTVVSWAYVPERSSGPGDAAAVTIAIVELDEGPWWWTQLIDVHPSTLTEGLRVEARFSKSGEDETHEYVLVFGPLILAGSAISDEKE